MYRRYSQVGDGSMPLSQVNRNRIKNIVIFVLIVALVVMTVISLPLMTRQNETHSLYINLIQRECREAYENSRTLSRTSGSDLAANLSRIRCNIYSIRTINNLSSSSSGLLVEEERLLTIQNTVDRYLENSNAGGQSTGELSSSLQQALSELMEIAERLE